MHYNLGLEEEMNNAHFSLFWYCTAPYDLLCWN